MTTRIERRAWLWPVFLLVAFAGAGCDQKGAAVASAAAPRELTQAADTGVEVHDLTLYGYNYTDTGIGSFEVNGHGGGNVEVSIPDAGGGKSACCVAVSSPLQQAIPIKIKWTRDSESWCELVVSLNPPLPPKPRFFEVHFYLDGHVEVAVTEESSPPRVVLKRAGRGGRHADEKRNVNNDGKFARCKVGYNE
jgi:Protein of unknown function (DUF3304)